MAFLGQYSIFYQINKSQLIITGFWDNRQDRKKLLKRLTSNKQHPNNTQNAWWLRSILTLINYQLTLSSADRYVGGKPTTPVWLQDVMGNHKKWEPIKM